MNKTILIGFMVANPEKRDTKTGKSMVTFKVTVKKRFPKEGAKYNYFDCIAFDKVADYIYTYCNSQSKVALIGSHENDKYKAQDGSTRYPWKFYVDQAEVVSSTVNAGDFQQQQQEQPHDISGFTEVNDDVELPFI